VGKIHKTSIKTHNTHWLSRIQEPHQIVPHCHGLFRCGCLPNLLGYPLLEPARKIPRCSVEDSVDHLVTNRSDEALIIRGIILQIEPYLPIIQPLEEGIFRVRFLTHILGHDENIYGAGWKVAHGRGQ